MSTTSPSPNVSGPVGLAIDGGNSKTEVVMVRLPGSAPRRDGAPLDRATEFARVVAPGSGGGPAEVASAVAHALEEAGGVPREGITRVMAAVAGLDFPGDEVEYRAPLAALLPHAQIDVVNDVVAVLDAGAARAVAGADQEASSGSTAPAPSSHALAIVCGAGLNAVARGPLGLATVPALGWPSGDWGGGHDVAREAVRLAARAEDGRGPRTVLAQRILELTGLPDMIAERSDELGPRGGVPGELIRELGVLPSYYLKYYYAHDATVAELAAATPRATVVAEVERELLALYADPSVDTKPPQLEARGGAFYSEAATALLASLVAGTGDNHVVNVRNQGLLPGLADDDVVETLCRIDASGATALPQEPVAPELLGLIQHVSAYERLTARAAVTGDRGLVRKALLAHPLVGQWDLVRALEKGLFETGAAYLPRFAEPA